MLLIRWKASSKLAASKSQFVRSSKFTRTWLKMSWTRPYQGISATNHISYWSHLNLVNAESLVGICEHLLPLPLDELDEGFEIPGRRNTTIRPSFLLVLFKGLDPRGNSWLELHLITSVSVDQWSKAKPVDSPIHNYAKKHLLPASSNKPPPQVPSSSVSLPARLYIADHNNSKTCECWWSASLWKQEKPSAASLPTALPQTWNSESGWRWEMQPQSLLLPP